MALLAWLFAAYLLLPLFWRRYEHRHPALDGTSWITRTGNDIPGDPMNIALVGSEKDIQWAMLSAKWFPADRITLASSLRIAAGTVFHRPYDDAPVSSLYFFGRKQDLFLFVDSFRGRIILAWVIGVVVAIISCVWSFYTDWPTGATVVVTFGIALLIAGAIHRFFGARIANNA